MAEPRLLSLRRLDVCTECGVSLTAGARAEWNPAARSVTCLACVEKRELETTEELNNSASSKDTIASVLQRGSPGASADRKYNALRNRREAHAKEKLGRRL